MQLNRLAFATDFNPLEFVKKTAIETSRMGPLVLELEALAARHGGEFDGWACGVVN